MEHDSSVDALAFSPSGASLLCSTAQGALGRLSLERKSYLTFVHAHTRPIIHAVANARGNQLSTTASDQTLRIWACQPTLPMALRQTDEFAVSVRSQAGGAYLS